MYIPFTLFINSDIINNFGEIYVDHSKVCTQAVSKIFVFLQICYTISSYEFIDK